MRIDLRMTFALPSAWLLAMSACGGSTPPPAAPAEAPQAESDAGPSAASVTAATPAEEAPKADAPAPTETPAAEAKPSSDSTLEKPTRPVRSILEAADTVFFVAFEESDPGKAAEGTCAKESGGDPQKNNACMAKARQTIEGKGYRFKKSPKGETTLTILRRQGNTLSTQHKFRYKYDDETENSVKIKLEGPDQGPIKWEKIPSEFKVEVPNDYMIVMQDPKLGRLVYYAKVGIPGD